MRRTFASLSLLLALSPLSGCTSLNELNRLAATGSIHESAPVKAHLQIEIFAPPAKVWSLLINAPAWPKWQDSIETVTATSPIQIHQTFTWSSGGTTIHSQVQLFEPEHRLAWTGTALTAKAIHVWELTPEAPNRTLVTMKESMEGPLMAQLYPSAKLAEADNDWLLALKHAAEQQP